MPRNRFEVISCFFHVVTPEEEANLANDPLKKIRPLHGSIRTRCLEYYQPLRELSIDERMVKSKARTHFRQYIRNKPTKWGFKYWVLADPTGYTVDFDLYCGQHCTDQLSGHGLSYDVVMELCKPFHFQGYIAFFDNFYTSPELLKALRERGIGATGTLRVSRRGVPVIVKELVKTLNRKDVPRGTGYYIREAGAKEVYICWKDNDCVTVLSNSYPGHAEGTARRKSKDRAGNHTILDVPLPSAIKHYNRFMGGVDKSDQLIGYHRVLRQTKRYWKTLFYHLLEIGFTNAYILHKWLVMMRGATKVPTESKFRDQVVLDIISKYGKTHGQKFARDDYQIRHGSTVYNSRRRCALCQKKTARRCPDCPFTPPLCQLLKRNCHELWHSTPYAVKRYQWFSKQKISLLQNSGRGLAPLKRSGRPSGVKNRRYRKKYFT